MKVEPRDIIGAIGLIGGFCLMALGVDHIVGGIVSAITAYYFGIRIVQVHKGGRR